MNPYISNAQKEFQAPIEHLKLELKHIRSGQANPELVDGIKVMAYETETPISQLANISIPEPKLIVIQPWDKSILKDIEKAIIGSKLGFSPVNDGSVIRIPMPPMSEENRKDLVKLVNEKAEKARIALRQVRDKVKETILKSEKEKEITEDDKYTYLKQLDEHTQSQTSSIKAIVDKKTDQIMKI